jgi:hypothetical protein
MNKGMVVHKMTFCHEQLVLSLPTAFLMNILLYGDPSALLNSIKQAYSTLRALTAHTCGIGLRMASFNHFKLSSIMSLYMSGLPNKWLRGQLAYLLNTPGQLLRLRTYSSHTFLVKELDSPLMVIFTFYQSLNLKKTSPLLLKPHVPIYPIS